VADGSVAYGFVAAGGTKDTTATGTNDTQIATNAGDSPEDFNILGANSTNWTLAASPGSEQYTHSFCTSGTGSPDPCDTNPAWTALTTSYQPLANNLAAAGTRRFDLRLSMPTSTVTLTQQTLNITVQAVQH
jgi:hypothetical protein